MRARPAPRDAPLSHSFRENGGSSGRRTLRSSDPFARGNGFSSRRAAPGRRGSDYSLPTRWLLESTSKPNERRAKTSEGAAANPTSRSRSWSRLSTLMAASVLANPAVGSTSFAAPVSVRGRNRRKASRTSASAPRATRVTALRHKTPAWLGKACLAFRMESVPKRPGSPRFVPGLALASAWSARMTPIASCTDRERPASSVRFRVHKQPPPASPPRPETEVGQDTAA